MTIALQLLVAAGWVAAFAAVAVVARRDGGVARLLVVAAAATAILAAILLEYARQTGEIGRVTLPLVVFAVLFTAGGTLGTSLVVDVRARRAPGATLLLATAFGVAGFLVGAAVSGALVLAFLTLSLPYIGP